MGQQQLLLIALGVIVVGIAIAVGVTLFKSNAESSNRNQVTSDLYNLGSVAQQFYRRPTSMAGGERTFDGFALTASQCGDPNGGYGVRSSAPNTAGGSADTAQQAISDSAQTIYIIGIGTEKGNTSTLPVEVCVKVTADSLIATVLN